MYLLIVWQQCSVHIKHSLLVLSHMKHWYGSVEKIPAIISSSATPSTPRVFVTFYVGLQELLSKYVKKTKDKDKMSAGYVFKYL